MNEKDILSQVNKIFNEVLENNDIKLKKETTASDIPEWDSLSHIQLVVAIEKFFNVKFTSLELVKFKNVGEMCQSILKKIENENR